MTSSRALLAVLLIILGVMLDTVRTDVGRLTTHVIHISDQIDHLETRPLILQSAPAIIGKPRVPPVRHIYKKAPTVIDDLCKPKQS